MKKIAISVLLYAIGCVGCVSEPHTSTSYSEPTFVVGPADWVLGTWDCDAGYHNIEPFHARSELATYTFTGGHDGPVTGVYAPLDTGTTPHAGWHETWTFDGDFEIGLTMDDGSFDASASDGFLLGAIPDTTILGVSEFDIGTITFPGKPERTWATGMISSSTPDGGAEFITSSRFGAPVGGGQWQYFDAECIRRR